MNAIFIIAGVGVMALVAEIVSLKRWLTVFVILGLLASLAFMPFMDKTWVEEQSFNAMLNFDRPAFIFIFLIVVVSIFWLWMSAGYLRQGAHQTDKTALVVFVILGAVIMASFNNMAMLFLGIEILSLSLYALAGGKKDSLSSIEAAFKYFLMGSFATGFLLFGIALIYGATGAFHLTDIYLVIAKQGETLPGFFYAGVLLMMVGLAFKVSAVPFHFWAPDVYEGSPTHITALMATVVKIAAVAAFWRIFGVCLVATWNSWSNILSGLIVLTLLIPNITAIYQEKVKRTLAYSSVGHVGYILLGFLGAHSIGNFVNPQFTFYYLAAYAVASLASFSVLIKVEESSSSFDGLYFRNPLLAVTMTIALMSMAGIPPLAGFVAKYYVFALAFTEGYPILVIIAVIASAMSAYYYFKIIVAMFSRTMDRTPLPVPISIRILLLIFILLIVGMGLYPTVQPINSLFN